MAVNAFLPERDLFQAGTETVGKTISIAGEMLTGADMAAGFARVLGEDVRYVAVEPSVYRGFGFPAAEELGNMFQVKAEFEDEYCGARELSVARSLNPRLQSFDQWLDANRDKISVEPAPAPA